MSRFNLSDWALDRRSLVWYFMIVFLLAGVFSYVRLGREEDPNFTIKTMVIQANWPGATARGNDASGHRADRAQARRAGIARLHQIDHHRRPDHGLRQSAADHQGPRRAADLDARAQHDRRHQEPVSRRRAGAVLQRPLRRRFRQYLRLHRRRPDLAPVARSGRIRALADPHHAQCRARRSRRRAGRGDLSRILDPTAGRARPRHAVGAQHAGGAERGDALGLRAGRAGAHRHPRQRAVHVRGFAARDQPARQRPLLSR